MTKQEQFEMFATNVSIFIKDYVIPQYGDFPDEHIDGMSIEEIKGKLSSYVARIGKVQINRGTQGALDDACKIAHFACYLYAKTLTNLASGDFV